MTTPVLRPLPSPWDRIVPITTRVLVWSSLFAIIYLLRSFFLLIFLTFVFAYIQSHASDRLANRIRHRTVRVILVALTLLGVLIGITAFLVPTVRHQAQVFAGQYQTHLRTFDKEILRLSDTYPVIEQLIPTVKDIKAHPEGLTLKTSPTAFIFQQIFGLDEEENSEAHIRETIRKLTEAGGKVLASASAFLLSLLFSFLIVLDLPRLTESVRGLRQTSLRFVYEEVALDIYEFGSVLGKALEAQLFVALLNTILTAIGIQLIGLGEHMAFLSVVVFICSFVPVAGVFISSIPICLLALQESGVGHFFLAILLITVIHMIETYILNPRIYGHHLHMNPVLVLSILTIGGKLFHIWGLILGVPICTYFFGHAIRRHRLEDSDTVTIP